MNNALASLFRRFASDVILVVEDESTEVMVSGFIIEPKTKGKHETGSIKVELQFLQKHKDLYMELHGDYSKNDYVAQSEAQLQNFKTLVLFEIALLMGADIEWATGGAAAASAGGAAAASAGPAGGPVLGSGGAGDDGEISDSNTPIFGNRTAAAAADKDDAAGASAAAGNDDGAGAAGPAGGGAANAANACALTRIRRPCCGLTCPEKGVRISILQRRRPCRCNLQGPEYSL